MARPTLQHAEVHSHYTPHPPNPKAQDAKRIIASINETYVTDPATGQKIYPTLVDQLIKSTEALAATYEHAPEPIGWTPPQRVVWRSSKLPHEHRRRVVDDRSLFIGVKAFASVRQGRWVITCPFTGCNGAQLASADDHRFWCVDCESRAVGGQWVEVVWPDHAKVETWLQNRPVDAMNWNPGEDGDDIAAQDEAAKAGIRLPSSVGKPAFADIDVSSWPKEATLMDGTVVPVLHCGTPEWDESQKDVV